MTLLTALVGYVICLFVASRVIEKRWGRPAAVAFGLAVIVNLVVFLVAVAAFEWTLSEFRLAPHGGERKGESRAEYFRWARVGFVGFYALLLAAAAAVGAVIARVVPAKPLRPAVASVAAIVPLLAITYYPVEYFNACAAGEPLFWPDYIACG